ncbi:MAG: DEAD/DEAH box helicase family protein, partial [Parasporobacterium sp.]|nr:DEAD/DEAH box helicase family protein [Parasporobacterium sp.]
MELKNYQKNVISDLTRYLELLNETGNIGTAYRKLWEEKNVPVGFGGVPAYQNILPGVPDLCFKVPTGGGKTFLACNAIKPVFVALPQTKIRAVVWLVPSDAILEQTLAALRNPAHPYRQKLDTDFGGRVEIYTKQELLAGQNFNITSVTEQLSVMVLSYDSFRGRKEALKARQENSSLAPMSKALGTPAYPIEEADETALLQVINQLSPLVIVDESHHARSTLSRKMLKDFNPCFVLDLTATPTKESNIISFVDAVQLKRENMVKLPVVVYNRSSQQEVVADAIDLRNHLEQQAITEEKNGGSYIRPIVLFQAQPKGKEDSTTFEKLRGKLVEAGIPAEEIAIKTADVNELKGIDLLDRGCRIRYIITVNALKEGWDCPFAYILASLANKTSQVDVEQILGRILRQPHTRRMGQAALNMSYVLTSSRDFKETLDGIVRGLNSAGFSGKDCRVAVEEDKSTYQYPEYRQASFLREEPSDYGDSKEQEASPEIEQEEFLDFDARLLSQTLEAREQSSEESTTEGKETHGGTASVMIAVAEKEGASFEAAMQQNEMNSGISDIPVEIQDKMTYFHINPEFKQEAKSLILPQFFMKVPNSIFADGYTVLLQKEHLAEGFTLKGKGYDIDFDRADDEIVKVDISDKEGSTPKVFKMSETDQRYFKEQFSRFSPEQKVRTCKDIIHRSLTRMDMIDDGELRNYIDRIVDDMDRETLAALEQAPQGFAYRIRKYVEALLDAHYLKTFLNWIEIERIIVEPYYKLPDAIGPLRTTNTFGKSLYQAEEEVNGFEYDMVMALTAMPNVRWWHRNISRQGFCINGFVKHYPDFIVETQSGK